MKFRILLNETEIETLKRTMGFKKLPRLLSRQDIMMSERRGEGNTNPLIIVPSSISHESSIIKSEMNDKTIRAYNIFLKYVSIDKHMTREEILEKFSETDKIEYDDIVKTVNELNQLYCKKYKKVMRVVRNLYGVISFVREQGIKHKYWYTDYIIPPENNSAIISAVSGGGVFEKEIAEEDLDMLEFLLRRTKEIKGVKKHGYNPSFYVPRLVNEFGSNREDVRSSLERLTGILCHVYGPENREYLLGGYFEKDVLFDNWLIPHNRIRLAEEVLSK